MDFLNFMYEPVTANLITAACLGSLLGLEREIARKDPSFRTFMLICVGSCTFSLMSYHTAMNYEIVRADPGRIAAQIVVGIGFLGAGTIFRSRERVVGLTTAALMWVCAAIGMAVGFDRFDIAYKATAIVLVFMVVLSYVHKLFGKIYGDEVAPPKKIKAEREPQ
jgi:putative Mg2+ transporter-C (MgtC) family protein